MKRKILIAKRTILIALFSLLPYFIIAQNSETVESRELVGIVLDSATRTPIPYATILINAQTSDFKDGVASAEDGRFRISLPCNQKYTFVLQCMGYKRQEWVIEQGKEALQKEFLLSQDVQYLDAVVVTARKKLIQLSNVGFSYDLKKDAGAQSESLLKAMRRVPLVVVDGEGRLKVKGTNDFSIYLNGKPFKMADMNPSQVLESIPAADIDKIDVITQPDASYGSDARSTIINIITQSKKIVGYSLLLSTRTATQPQHNSSLTYSFVTNRLRLSTQYSFDLSDQPAQPSQSNRQISLPTGEQSTLFTQGQASGRFTWHTGRVMLDFDIDSLNTLYADAHLKLSGSSYTAKMKRSFDYNGHTTHTDISTKNAYSEGAVEGNMIYRNLRKSDKKERFSLGYRFAYSPDNRSIELGSGDPSSPQAKSSSTGGMSEHALSLDALLYNSKKFAIKAGGLGMLRFLKSDMEYFAKETNSDAWHPTQHGQYKQTYRNGAAYVSSSLFLGHSMLGLGLRAEYTSFDSRQTPNSEKLSESYTNLFPKVSFSTKLTDELQFSLSYAYGIRRPSIWLLNPYKESVDAYSVSYGNPLLKTQHNHTTSLSLVNFGSKHFAYLSVDYSLANRPIYTRNFAESTNVQTQFTTYENGKRSQRIGYTLSLNYRPTTFLSTNLNLSGGYHLFQPLDLSIQKAFSHSTYFSCDLTLPKKWFLGGNIQYAHMEPTFGAFYKRSWDYGMYVSKSFFREQFEVSLQITSPFSKRSRFQATEWGDNLRSVRSNDILVRSVGLKLSYKLSSGKKASVVKRQHQSIENDLDRTTGVQ